MPEITWQKYEKDIHSQDPEIARKALDAFEAERNLQTSTSKAAKEWEADRKKEVLKNKSAWVKDKRKKDQVKEFSEGLRSWSGYDQMIQPCANYLIVATEEKESQTESGIIVTTEAVKNNIGVCVAIGSDYVSPYSIDKIKPPCQAGDKILFKLGAGIEIEIKDRKYKFMQYQDVLGIFKDNA